MEVENLRRIKRKRWPGKTKLDVNERVEARSMEPGFLGSWHPGTVIRCGKLKRHVRYDNLLDDKGVKHLVDEVVVSNALDGDGDSSDRNMRGSIRSLPPPIEFEGWELKFGVCVDVNHQEAWWEGVIFDHCDGMEERSVFFPDLGDEMKVGFHQMRITYDWNEVTGKWRRRGKWVFLELLEECERTSIVAVSAKQVWYDVRAKEEFHRIRDWTCNVKDLWRDMVMGVVSDYLTITLKEISSLLDLPRSLVKETQELEPEEPRVTVDFNQAAFSQHSTKETLLRATNEIPPNKFLENAGMRVPKPHPRAQDNNRVAFRPPPIRPSCPRPVAARPPLFRPTNATATPILHAPVPPPPMTSATPIVVQSPSTSSRSSPPPNEPIAAETYEAIGREAMFPKFMRFMPTPGYKPPNKMENSFNRI